MARRPSITQTDLQRVLKGAAAAAAAGFPLGDVIVNPVAGTIIIRTTATSEDRPTDGSAEIVGVGEKNHFDDYFGK